MMPDMQNPGLAPRASRDCFGGLSHPFTTELDWRAQLVASRYCLLPTMAREVSALLFGGPGYE
jgi:hypothetical protein